MGIRKKIFTGFVIVGFILFLSGIISVFQLIAMEKSISGMLSDNVRNVELSKYMIDALESQSWNVLDIITKQKTGSDAKLHFHEEDFNNLIISARNNLTAGRESGVIDSLEASYKMYHKNLKNLDSLFALPDIDKRIVWFVDLYQPSYLQFIASIKKLWIINQNALFDNSRKLEGSFYRMLMPPIIAITAGLFLIILFNYFINLYFINPILRIHKSIRLFLDTKKSYTVSIDTKDEINDLNEDVKVLISQFKKDTPVNKQNFDLRSKS
ncbi:MAG: MCP four helix bundle domain-containing protein [Prevotellaceae bacterium]|jgi:hypothetical protein|nr:MCP four helix bundle domain-containing protein [Prevotellaceae bacterium]